MIHCSLNVKIEILINVQVLDTCDIVVDVGGVYNPKTNRFDHHQRGFEETLSSVRPDLSKKNTIKYVYFPVYKVT